MLMRSCVFGVKLAKQVFTMTLSTSGLVTMNKKSATVQPASNNHCDFGNSNVGKGPQPNIAEDNGVGFVQSSSSSTANDDIEGKGLSALTISNIDDESSSLQTLINSEASSSSTSVLQRLLALPATSINSAETSTTAKADFEEVDDKKMMVDNDESNSLQTINSQARNSSAESSLPATSSSSAKTALVAITNLPATSSNANSTDIMDTVILSSDYNQIANIADQIFSDIGAVNFSGSVLCLYAQALRTHFMTHTHFKRRDNYKRLNAVTTYKQHKDFFSCLQEITLLLTFASICLLLTVSER
jgi:hypothetical protein